MKWFLILPAVFLIGFGMGWAVCSSRRPPPKRDLSQYFVTESGSIQLYAGYDARICVTNGTADLKYTDEIRIGFNNGRPCICICDLAKTNGDEYSVIDLVDLARTHGKVVRADDHIAESVGKNDTVLTSLQ